MDARCRRNDVIVGASDCDSSRPSSASVHAGTRAEHALAPKLYLRGLDGRLPERAGDSRASTTATQAPRAAIRLNATTDDKGSNARRDKVSSTICGARTSAA
jgi:hypothetical protein